MDRDPRLCADVYCGNFLETICLVFKVLLAGVVIMLQAKARYVHLGLPCCIFKKNNLIVFLNKGFGGRGGGFCSLTNLAPRALVNNTWVVLRL